MVGWGWTKPMLVCVGVGMFLSLCLYSALCGVLDEG